MQMFRVLIPVRTGFLFFFPKELSFLALGFRGFGFRVRKLGSTIQWGGLGDSPPAYCSLVTKPRFTCHVITMATGPPPFQIG